MNSQLTIAVHILAVLANREGQGAVTSEEIAEGFGTNPVVIRRVMSLLKKAELVKSRPGTGGGSFLGRPAEEITLRDAYNAVTIETGSILGRQSGNCRSNIPIAPIIAEYLNELYEDAEKALIRRLGSVTISDFRLEIANRAKASLSKVSPQ